MKRLLLPLALTLSACTTTPLPPATSAAVSASVDRAEAAYLRAKPYAVMMLPYLSPERAARVRLAMDLIERAFVAARIATTVAGQMGALAAAEAAMGEVAGVR